MRLLAALLAALVGMLAGTSHAQNWILFIPAERDFRVLFPNPPTRSTDSDGSTVFRSRIEAFEYAVYRLPPGTAPIANARAEIARRLSERLGDDAQVRHVRDDDEDGVWQREVFEVRPGISVHRLVEYGGRYYELQVLTPREHRGMARNTARDFFNSFQLSGVPPHAIGVTLVQRLEAWCQTRTNPFARAFCEYSVCLQPGSEKYPHCARLPGR